MFVLKKIIAQILYPIPLCLETLIAGLFLLLFTRKQRIGKSIVTAGVILFAILSSMSVPKMLLRPLERQYLPLNITTPSDTSSGGVTPSVKWIVVLGGGHTTDQEIPVTSQVSDESLVRLIEGVRLHNKIPGSKLILSGGKVFDAISDAEVMGEIAMGIGVKQEDIVLESSSKDTEEQAQLIEPIVGNDEFILVTSAVHMPRSIALFRKLGMHPIPAPTGHLVKESQGINPLLFFPDAYGFSKVESAFHEYLGLVWAKLRGKI
jgi:uncharacterized SAM-binding protein YcdF (DUF218 family)